MTATQLMSTLSARLTFLSSPRTLHDSTLLAALQYISNTGRYFTIAVHHIVQLLI